MTTKAEMIAILEAENPDGLRIGDDTDGYTQLTKKEYDAQIAEWADHRLAKEVKAQALADAAIAFQALLDKLGITAEEAALLLGQ